MTPSEVPFDGTSLQLGRTTYVVPPLSLGAVKKVAKRIEGFAKLSVEEQMDLTAEIALLALRRNYPEITREQIEDLLDLRNMETVFKAVVDVSGFTAQRVEVGAGPGNAAGGTDPTGTPSTPT